jgi:hypothetical protein
MGKNHLLFCVVAPVSIVIMLTSCSQLGPNDTEFKSSLQASIPKYWEIESVNIESRENTGTNTVPQIQTRFKAKAKLKEDTFKKVENYKIDIPDPSKLEKIDFITLSESKGKTADAFGVASSARYNDTWRTSFQIDGDPFGNKGLDFSGFSTSKEVKAIGQAQPRSFFEKKTVLTGSPEEEALKSELIQQIKSEEKQILSKLLSGRHDGSGFEINFISSNLETKKVSGEMEFINLYGRDIRRFEGTISDTELKFTLTEDLKGFKSDLLSSPGRLGNTYSFPLSNLTLKKRYSASNDIILEGRWVDARQNRGGGTAEITIKDAIAQK